jgi:hypothetical protein
VADIFVTFATCEYFNAAWIQAVFVRLFGGKHIIFTPHHLPLSMQKYCEANKRGYGYWVWKPYLISMVFQKIKNNDRLFWLDAAILPLQSLKSLVFEDAFVQSNIFSDPRSWCKSSICLRLEHADSFFRNGFVPDASLIGFSKTIKAQDIVDKWLGCCQDHSLISDDKHGELPAYPLHFQDHRHDQALLGYVAMCLNVPLSKSVSQFGLGPLMVYHHRMPLISAKQFIVLGLNLAVLFLKRFICGGNLATVKLSKRYLYHSH